MTRRETREETDDAHLDTDVIAIEEVGSDGILDILGGEGAAGGAVDGVQASAGPVYAHAAQPEAQQHRRRESLPGPHLHACKWW